MDNSEMLSFEEEFEIMIRPLRKLYIKLSGVDYSEENHNEWVERLNKFVEKSLDHRKGWVLEYAKNYLPKKEECTNEVKSFLLTLNQRLEEEIKKRLLCLQTCRKCQRLCKKPSGHNNNCSCQTDHTCKQQCSSCMDHNLCYKFYGHTGAHRCKQAQHQCQEYCEKPGCKARCKLEVEHANDLSHHCLNRHYCEEYCVKYPRCNRKCIHKIEQSHSQHICGEKSCPYRCVICEAPCVFPDHLHEYHIKNGDTDKLKYQVDGVEKVINFHICGNEHLCPEECPEEGICQLNYEIIDRNWDTELTKFEYQYFKPKEIRAKCTHALKPFSITHEGNHGCGNKRCCTHQCPECKSYCKNDFNHPGLHSTIMHRNKENNVFVAKQENRIIEVMEDHQLRKYMVGESTKPENCSSSCRRKGRAHFHLKECKGGDLCGERVYPNNVKHSCQTWYPFMDKTFDLWLCEAYWKSFDWMMPVQEGSVITDIGLCNYYCSHRDHASEDPIRQEERFCTKPAWHQGNHNFHCEHPQENEFQFVEIVFCFDTTDSMDSMGKDIRRSKETIKRITNSLREKVGVDPKKVLRFGFVAYRDHPPQSKKYITKVKDMCSTEEILSFIESLEVEGGGDLAEAVMDGLYDSITKISWTKEKKWVIWGQKKLGLRVIIHVADGPPHGKEYGCKSDVWPDGCPCGIKIHHIASLLKEHNIHYKLIKIGKYLEKMAEIFKRHIEKYEEVELNNADDLEIKVSNMIAQELENTEFDLKKSSVLRSARE